MSHALQSNTNGPSPQLVFSAHDSSILTLAYLPDGRGFVTGSDDGSVKVWSEEQEGTLRMKHEREISNILAATQDGTKVISGDGLGRIQVWDVESPSHEPIHEWTHPESCFVAATISPDNRLVAVGYQTVLIYTMEGKPTNHSIELGGFLLSMSFSPDSDKLAYSTDDGIHVYDFGRSTLVLSPWPHWQTDKSKIYAIRILWSRDGSSLFCSSDTKIDCWSPITGEHLGRLQTGHTDWICSLSLSPTGSVLASTSWDKTVYFWDVASGKCVGHLKHVKDVTALCFCPSGKFVASAECDGKIYLWREPWLLPASPPDIQYGLRGYYEPLPGPRIPLVPSYSSRLATKPQSILSIRSPPPDLTRYIIRIKNQYSAGGSFGDVYKCRYTGGSVPLEVAVKAFRFSFTMKEDTENKSIKMLRRELGIWRRLEHGNIVPFLGIAYGFGMDGAMSLVSLWMPNESLHKFLTNHDDKLDVVYRLQFLLNIADGLCYLHSFSVIHGDLNSNNVLLDADYTARLTDFGYASLVGNIPEALAYLQRSTVRPGALRWIAPEQINPDESFTRTIKSDIYSYGCIALQVLSGKQPWSEIREDAAVIFRLAKGHKPGRPESRAINDSHWTLIQQCWSSIEERPEALVIILSIRQFLNIYPPSPPLRDFLARQ